MDGRQPETRAAPPLRLFTGLQTGPLSGCAFMVRRSLPRIRSGLCDAPGSDSPVLFPSSPWTGVKIKPRVVPPFPPICTFTVKSVARCSVHLGRIPRTSRRL
ncbi:hypothetical protein HPB50_010609 [Hyalomma asiaticum]|uniref:Uncharacterized protein n=1 Tax=Hyalomma asiaticum TaxID=266040 RepID=A0ACB7S5J0_HYAAI|nr:hypothetical protein HPB50_010609 [Hyalomma asiaticum]